MRLKRRLIYATQRLEVSNAAFPGTGMQLAGLEKLGALANIRLGRGHGAPGSRSRHLFDQRTRRVQQFFLIVPAGECPAQQFCLQELAVTLSSRLISALFLAEITLRFPTEHRDRRVTTAMSKMSRG